MKVLIGALKKDRKAEKFEILENLLDADTVIVCLGPSRLEVLAQTVVEIAKKRGARKSRMGSENSPTLLSHSNASISPLII